MTLAEFVELDHKRRLNAIGKAVCIGGRRERDCTVLLYQLDNFYVEAYHEPQTRRIVCLSAFEDVDRLGPYLQQLNITI